MLSHIIYSLSFKMVYIVYLGQKRGARPPLNPPLRAISGSKDIMRVHKEHKFSAV